METFFFTRAPDAYRFAAEAVDPVLAALVMDVPVRLIFLGDGVQWLVDSPAARVLGQLEFFDDVEIFAVDSDCPTAAGHPVRRLDRGELDRLLCPWNHVQTADGWAPVSQFQTLDLSDDGAGMEQLTDLLEQDVPLSIWWRP